MSETKIEGTPARPVPANIPEELVPVYEWFRENGRDILLQAAIVLIAVVAAVTFVKYRASSAAAASASLLTANDVAGLEDLNGRYGSSKVGPLIRLRLARAYYDAGNFESAAAAYAAFVKSERKHPLLAEARLGYAGSLEAQGNFAEALEAYDGISGDATSPAYALAALGKARCLAAKGDKAAAEEAFDALAAETKGTQWENVAKSQKALAARFDGFRKPLGIMERMNALESATAPADAADISSAAEPAAPAAELAAEPAAAPDDESAAAPAAPAG